MLRAVLNSSWKKHPIKQQLYRNLAAISNIIREIRMRFAGHLWRTKQDLISNTLLWRPPHGNTCAGRPTTTCINQICADHGCLVEDFPRL